MSTSAREVWKSHVEAWATSGLTCAEYAKKSGVHPGTLASWRSKLKGPRLAVVSKPIEFVEVPPQVTAQPPRGAGMTELLVGGVQILIHGTIEADALRPVLTALGGRR